jgi:glutamate synthase (NADPH/NADH) small chain
MGEAAAVAPGEKKQIDRKQRSKLDLVPVRHRSVEERRRDFEETSVGYTAEEAMAEAARCIHCPEPAACVAGCPLGNDVEKALWCVEKGDFLGAAEIYRATNPIPEICGRVCPDESSCATLRALAGKASHPGPRGLHRRLPAQEWASRFRQAAPTGKKIAVVGASRPGSLGRAVCRARVVVYDAFLPRTARLASPASSWAIMRWKTWLRDLGVEFVMTLASAGDRWTT